MHSFNTTKQVNGLLMIKLHKKVYVRQWCSIWLDFVWILFEYGEWKINEHCSINFFKRVKIWYFDSYQKKNQQKKSIFRLKVIWIKPSLFYFIIKFLIFFKNV